jgi:hypothetical protein
MKLVGRLIARWRRHRARKHLCGWDVPTFDPDTGDLTEVRDTLARMAETDRLRKARSLP